VGAVKHVIPILSYIYVIYYSIYIYIYHEYGTNLKYTYRMGIKLDIGSEKGIGAPNLGPSNAGEKDRDGMRAQMFQTQECNGSIQEKWWLVPIPR
jgi:hypothetical protein